MKKLFITFAVCALFICCCAACTQEANKEVDSNATSSSEATDKPSPEVDSSTNSPTQPVVDRAVLEDIKKRFQLEDRIIKNISPLIDAGWTTSGREVVIRFLNDIRLYEGDEQITIPFTGALYGKYAKGQPYAAEVESFIEQINSLAMKNGNPLVRYEIKDLIITMTFSGGEKVIFDTYYKALQE